MQATVDRLIIDLTHHLMLATPPPSERRGQFNAKFHHAWPYFCFLFFFPFLFFIFLTFEKITKTRENQKHMVEICMFNKKVSLNK